jgi:putative glycosyltransferase (TIGR04372 family)
MIEEPEFVDGVDLFRPSIEYLKGEVKQLLAPKAPRRMIAFFGGAGLGAFIRQNLVAAWIAKKFPILRVVAAYKDNADFKAFITDCNPGINSEMKAAANSAATLLVDWFDIGLGAPVKCASPEWDRRQLSESDIILLPPMIPQDLAHLDGFAEKPPCLRLPGALESRLLETLEEAGLDRGRWFACVHMGTEDAAVSGPYLDLLRHMVEEQGGQIVRVGFLGEPPLAGNSGVIDLARAAGSFPLQAAAISRARYVIGDGSGYATLAGAFRTPGVVADTIEYGKLVWNEGDMVLAKRIFTPLGELLVTSRADEEGLLNDQLPEGFRVEANSAGDLIAAADAMFDATADCPAWREPPEESKVAIEPGLTLPLAMRDEPLVTFLDQKI